MDTEDTTDTFDPNDIRENNRISALAYVLFIIPLAIKNDSEYVKYHANQGLIFLITAFALWVVCIITGMILGGIPFLGWLFGFLLNNAVKIILLSFFVIGIFNALTGKAKDLPLIGKFKIIK